MTIEIDRSPDEVWAVVGAFGGLDRWMPGVTSCTVEGDTRTLTLGTMTIVERRFGSDDAARSLSYGIVGGSVPVERHRAEVRVSPGPSGTGSTVRWGVDVEPAAMLPVMEESYRRALEALQSHLSG